MSPSIQRILRLSSRISPSIQDYLVVYHQVYNVYEDYLVGHLALGVGGEAALHQAVPLIGRPRGAVRRVFLLLAKKLM